MVGMQVESVKWDKLHNSELIFWCYFEPSWSDSDTTVIFHEEEGTSIFHMADI